MNDIAFHFHNLCFEHFFRFYKALYSRRMFCLLWWLFQVHHCYVFWTCWRIRNDIPSHSNHANNLIWVILHFEKSCIKLLKRTVKSSSLEVLFVNGSETLYYPWYNPSSHFLYLHWIMLYNIPSVFNQESW